MESLAREAQAAVQQLERRAALGGLEARDQLLGGLGQVVGRGAHLVQRRAGGARARRLLARRAQRLRQLLQRAVGARLGGSSIYWLLDVSPDSLRWTYIVNGNLLLKSAHVEVRGQFIFILF